MLKRIKKAFIYKLKIIGKFLFFSNKNYERKYFIQEFLSPFNIFGKNEVFIFGGEIFVFSNMNELYTLNGLYKEIFVTNCYDIVIKNCNKIYDLGSNVGVSIIKFRKLFPSANIYAFEPSTLAFNYLNKNIELNKLSKIFTYNVAVLNKNDRISYDINTIDVGNNVFRKSSAYINCIDIKDLFLNNEIIDLLKMDIEKSEYIILERLIECDLLKYIRNMIIEFHEMEKYNFSYLLMVLLKNYNIKIIHVDKKYSICIIHFTERC